MLSIDKETLRAVRALRAKLAETVPRTIVAEMKNHELQKLLTAGGGDLDAAVAMYAQPAPQQEQGRRANEAARDAPIPAPAPAQPARGRLVSTSDAKAAYFLTPDDLRLLRCHERGGGFGCGAPSKFYESQQLEAAAIQKHGRAGYEAKLAARQKREGKKRQREAEAAEATTAFQRARAVAHTAPSPAAPPAQLAALRKSLLKMAKQRLGFEDSGGPKNWKVEVPGQDAAAFAALAGRAGDDRLATFVKRGAYYHAEVGARQLFGCARSELQRWFKREGVGIEIEEAVGLRYKPSDATLAVLGGGELY